MEPRKYPAGRSAEESSETIEEEETMIMAGKPAPNFTAPAYYKGKFTHIELSQYLGKWVVLYFYGGDYTFV